MVRYPEYHLGGEIIRILRPGPGPSEAVVRVRGRHYDPARPETFVHVRVRDPSGRVRKLGPGRRVRILLLFTARFVEEAPGAARTHRVDLRFAPGAPVPPIRVVGHDTRVAGVVRERIDEETVGMDAGIRLLLRIPAAPELPEPGVHVEFLVQDPVLAELL